MKKFNHLFFDLDETLWDYRANAKDTIVDLFDRFGLNENGRIGVGGFVDEFFRTNQELWRKYDQGLIAKDQIRKDRFPIILERLEINNFEKVEDLQECFLLECPQRGKLVDYAMEILEKLKGNYRLHIITNGFEEIQMTKLTYSGLDKYFEQIITSERASFQKPDPRIFRFAMNSAGARSNESVMIGDNLDTDIQGAIKANMDQIYFNPGKVNHNHDVTYEISHLHELEMILLNE